LENGLQTVAPVNIGTPAASVANLQSGNYNPLSIVRTDVKKFALSWQTSATTYAVQNADVTGAPTATFGASVISVTWPNTLVQNNLRLTTLTTTTVLAVYDQFSTANDGAGDGSGKWISALTVDLGARTYGSSWVANTFSINDQYQPWTSAFDATHVIITWLSTEYKSGTTVGTGTNIAVAQIISTAGVKEGTEFVLSPNPATFRFSAFTRPAVTTVSPTRFLSDFSTAVATFGNDIFIASWQRYSTLTNYAQTVDYLSNVGQPSAIGDNNWQTSPYIYGAPYALYQLAQLSYTWSASDVGTLSVATQDPLQNPTTPTWTLETLNNNMKSLTFTSNRFVLDDFNVTWSFNDGVTPVTALMNFHNTNTAPTYQNANLNLDYYERRKTYLMGPANFKCDDANFGAGDVWFTFTELRNGRFSYVKNFQTTVTSFSQQEIQDSVVVFHDEGNNQPLTHNDGSVNKGARPTTCKVSCTNGILASDPVDCNVVVSSGALLQPLFFALAFALTLFF